MRLRPTGGVAFSKDPKNPGYTPSGWFDNRVPGLFFDTTDAQSSESQRVSGATPLRLIHEATWPGDEALDVAVVPLVSNPGYPAATSYDVADVPGCDRTGAIKLQTYQRMCKSTLDSRKGSSGGAVLVNEVGEFYQTEADRQEAMVAVGVLSGGVGAESWGDPCEVTEPNPVFSTDCYSRLTLLSQTLAEWAVLVPTMTTPIESAEEPFCSRIDSDTTCDYHDAKGNPVKPELAEDRPQTLDGQAEGVTINHEQVIGMHCDFTGDGGKGFGIAIGLTGAAILDERGEPTGIGSFRLVCAPWSTTSWHLNWRWLYFHGRSAFTATKVGEEWDIKPNDALRTAVIWGAARLWRALTLVSEERFRTDGSSYLRPASMMLCPPNYAMQGFVTYSPDLETHLGVKELLCVRVDDPTQTLHSRFASARTSKQTQMVSCGKRTMSFFHSLARMVGTPHLRSTRTLVIRISLKGRRTYAVQA